MIVVFKGVLQEYNPEQVDIKAKDGIIDLSRYQTRIVSCKPGEGHFKVWKVMSWTGFSLKT